MMAPRGGPEEEEEVAAERAEELPETAAERRVKKSGKTGWPDRRPTARDLTSQGVMVALLLGSEAEAFAAAARTSL